MSAHAHAKSDKVNASHTESGAYGLRGIDNHSAGSTHGWRGQRGIDNHLGAKNKPFVNTNGTRLSAEQTTRIKNTRKKQRESGNRRFSLFYGKLIVHPLFLLFGIWYSFTGELFSFLSVTACALLHELAHAAAAAKIGYAAGEIVLMPYGATLTADLDGVSAKDEIYIALAGPLCNFAVAILFLALWWCFPSAYPYTETAFSASLSLGVCNLLPALPLDGGRVAHRALIALLEKRMPPAKARKTALLVSRIITLSVCLFGGVLFLLLALRGIVNFSLVAFSLFLAAGAFTRKKSTFVKMNFSMRSAFERGIPLKQIALSSACSVKKSLAFLSPDCYLVLHVYDKRERFVGTITQNELSEFFAQTGLYATLGEYFVKFPTFSQKQRNYSTKPLEYP